MTKEKEVEKTIQELFMSNSNQKKETAHAETAKEFYSMYKAFVDAGFTEEQAWEIFTMILKSQLKTLFSTPVIS